jgi:hypothetical protein
MGRTRALFPNFRRISGLPYPLHDRVGLAVEPRSWILLRDARLCQQVHSNYGRPVFTGALDPRDVCAELSFCCVENGRMLL